MIEDSVDIVTEVEEDRIEIPEANRKDIKKFAEYPDEMIVKEIMDHIRETGKPHTWRGHSHTKPAKGVRVLYREEFDVPEKGSFDGYAPCPCCRPTSRVYKRNGKIAWFPDEHVIRLIGPKCFQALNPEGHKAAMAELQARRKKEADLASISANYAVLGKTIEAIDGMMPIAEQIEELADGLKSVFGELRIDIWREARGGILRVRKTRMVDFVRPDGTAGRRPDEYFDDVGTFGGPAIFDPHARSMVEKLGVTRAGLVAVGERLDQVGIDGIDDKERLRFAEILPRGRTDLDEVRQRILDRQPFATRSSIAALRQWGRHPDNPKQFGIALEGNSIVVEVRDRRVPVKIGKDVASPVPDLPTLRSD